MDEFTAAGDRVETFFTDEIAVKKYMRHLSTELKPSDARYYFAIAVGDDSDLIREGNSVIDVARPLRDEFEDDPQPIPFPSNDEWHRDSTQVFLDRMAA